MAYRMISNPTDITPTFAIDSVDDLPKLLKEGYDEQGTCALIVPTSEHTTVGAELPATIKSRHCRSSKASDERIVLIVWNE